MSDLIKLQKDLLQPSKQLIEDIKDIQGDILILGIGGKMGPNLAILAKNAIAKAGKKNRIIGVSRFSEQKLKNELEAYGIETKSADLLDDNQLQSLPEVRNVIFMAGTKFGTKDNESLTWAMNSYLPGRVAEKFKDSRIVVFSTGNIYPFMPTSSHGASESIPPSPIGEYGQSCLGRERVFEYFSKKHHTPMLIYRLNYAIDFTYGVLVEIAKSVLNNNEIDLTTGFVNVIWQDDANEYALRSFKHCTSPPEILNITGSEIISVKWLAEEFGRQFNKNPIFINKEAPTALLSNAAKAHEIFGNPKTPLLKMIDYVASWIKEGRELMNKPTHFQERKGNF